MNSPSLPGRLILVCEDEPLIALELADAFQKAGARTVITRSLRDALVAAENGALSAAILDHALSDGDSSQLCERLKERGIPYVLYSGFSNLDGACGDAVHISKPASPEVLVTTVAGLLNRRPTLHLHL